MDTPFKGFSQDRHSLKKESAPLVGMSFIAFQLSSSQWGLSVHQNVK
jgi:hypothetical protein